MHAGRPPIGVDHVDTLVGSRDGKLRLRTILETVGEQISVGEACERLGIQSSRFHRMRHDALQAALDRLAPRTGGRHRRLDPADTELIGKLQAEREGLKRALVIAQTRTEVALVRPGGRGRRRRRR